MFGKNRCITAMSWIAVGALCAGWVSAQQAPEPANRQIEVTGNNVYVRSGPSVNHYPVCKLNAGDRAVLVGEQGSWYEILPPAGTFSLISGDFVDTADGKHGVVNGNNVRVRAASTLPAYVKSRYKQQTQLSKGHEVEILERLPDGFLRIVPPRGATLWIHRDLAVEVPADRLAAGPPPSVAGAIDPPAGRALPVAGTQHGGDASVSTNQATARLQPQTTSPTGQPLDKARAALERLDALVKAEMKKPGPQRKYEPLVPKYEAIADGSADPVVTAYVARRVDQLRYLIDLTTTLQRIERLNQDSESRRRQLLSERSAIPTVRPSVPGGFAAKGELRISALYDETIGLRRYRLVDPMARPVRTVGYVELPADTEIQIEDFLGRFVGVRASSTHLQEGGVDSIPIHVAAELVVLRVVGDDAGEAVPERTP